jgi:hypothetical protein
VGLELAWHVRHRQEVRLRAQAREDPFMTAFTHRVKLRDSRPDGVNAEVAR